MIGATITDYTDPAPGPGEQATARETPTCDTPAPELPAPGPGAAAKGTQNTSGSQQRRNLPASAGAAGRNQTGNRQAYAGRDTSGQPPGGEGQKALAAHLEAALSDTTRPAPGQTDGGRSASEDRSFSAAVDLRFSDPLVAEIVQLHRMRRRWIKARNALILQGKAFGRAVCGGDKIAGSAAFDRVVRGAPTEADAVLADALLPFVAAIAHFDASLGPIERRLERLAKRLPVAPFVEATRGLGYGSVAAIVGEAGDLSAYPSVAGVWKRMGLAVIDGDGRQRRVADAERALIHGYNPERRSVVWNAGNGVIGGMGLGKRPLSGEDIEARTDWTEYERLFVARLRHEAARDPAMRLPDTKEGKESYTRFAAARAKRYVEKRLLRDMTLAWRRAVGQCGEANLRAAADRPTDLLIEECA